MWAWLHFHQWHEKKEYLKVNFNVFAGFVRHLFAKIEFMQQVQKLLNGWLI